VARVRSAETELRHTTAELRKLNQQLADAIQQRDTFRGRATKAEQESAEWKRRFDLLLEKSERVAI